MQQKRALALGFFDGVHPAHRRVLALARTQADALGIHAAAVTFDRQPAAFIRGTQEELICTLDERIRLLKEEGRMDEVIVLPFDEAMMNTAPEDFVNKTLLDTLGAQFVSVGFDYRFGKNGTADANMLRTLCAARGAACAIAGEYRFNREKISSSAIRTRIAAGDVVNAAQLLGRPFSFSGIVRHGKALGRTLGFPTMNVPLPTHLVRPKPGVYICRTRLRGAWHDAVCNISETRLCEVFMLGHNEDAYGQEVAVELYEFVRPMRRFSGPEELKNQVDFDKKYASNWFIIRYGNLF